MKKIFNFPDYISIRLGAMLSLIFFACAPACKNEKPGELKLIWKDNKAIALSIPLSLADLPEDSLHLVSVKLEGNEMPVLGNYSLSDGAVLFNPVISFSPRHTYKVLVREKLIGQITVTALNSSAPQLVSVFPKSDTLPENLLKIYLEFSQPMQEGVSENYVALLNDKGDTLPGTFLNLQPELWNPERTVLTLWLDPGRIKRHLGPNEELGNPLKPGKQYTLNLSREWRSADGNSLSENYRHSFFVGTRDSISPDPATWTLRLPKSETSEPLTILLDESLDYFLLQETITVQDGDGILLEGIIHVDETGTVVKFTPKKPWKSGSYTIAVAPQLEDLAGNNLERVFDRDLTVQSKPVKTNFRRQFRIDP